MATVIEGCGVFLQDIITNILIALLSGAFLHCFFDDKISLTKKRIIVYLSGLVLVIICNFILAIVIIIVTCSRELSDDLKWYILWITERSYPLLCAVILSVQKGIGIKKTVTRIIAELLVFKMIWANCLLVTSLAGYTINMSGILTISLLDFSFNRSLFLTCFSSLWLSIAFFYLYHNFYKKQLTMYARKIDIICFILYIVFLEILEDLFAMIENDDISLAMKSDFHRCLIAFIMLVLVIALPIVMMKNRINVYYKELSDHQQSFLEMELNASQQYKAAQEDTRAFRHDVQNNLSVMAMLMKEGKIKEAEEYLNDMRTEVSSFSPKVVSGDDMVDSLISSKLAKMDKNGISFSLDGVIDGGLDWKPMDICTVFANMIDNAIEAASKTENGFIRMEFKKSGQKRLIRAFNSCAEDVDCEKLMAGGGHITSKEDKNLHGYGISNIRRTVEKYGGMMQISCAEKIFTMDIVLMN